MYQLGQTIPPEITYPPVAQVYDELKAICLTKLPAETCEGILPKRYLYYPPEVRPRVPAWLWVLAGVVIGRLFYAKQ